jgi:ABC-type transporter Mla MlaB component
MPAGRRKAQAKREHTTALTLFMLRRDHEHDWTDAMLDRYDGTTLALLIDIQRKDEEAGRTLTMVR